MRRVGCRRSMLFTLVGALTVAGGCGSSDGAEADLTPLERSGLELVKERGCPACHGDDGGGGVGPAWVGLAGSEVELEDGTVVVADTDYLRRSILDPQADRVAGYSARMPPNTLTDEQVDAIVAYIESQ